MKGFLGGVSLGAIACAFGVSTLGLIIGPPTRSGDPQTSITAEPDMVPVLDAESEANPAPAAESQPTQHVADTGIAVESDVAADMPSVANDSSVETDDVAVTADGVLDYGAIDAQAPVADPPALVPMSDDPNTPDADVALPPQPELAPVDSVDGAEAPAMPGRVAEDQELADRVEITSQSDQPVRPIDQDIPDLVAPDQHETAPVALADPDPVDIAPAESPSVVFRPRTEDAVDPVADVQSKDQSQGVAEQSEPPLERYAAQHTARQFAPRMAFILVDPMSDDGVLDTLATLSIPVSIALAPDDDGAARDRMHQYRDLGYEVFALADVDADAQSSDLETSLNDIVSQLPEIVGFLEPEADPIDPTGFDVDAVTAFVVESGHGLVLQAGEVNSALANAVRSGAAVSSVFRTLGLDGIGSETIRFTLSQASFRAKQRGAIVMLGSADADTISALKLWVSLEGAEDVDIVPASTVLREMVSP